ncbi:MAG: LLM class flavin-dependent oxidoreductase [Pseudomonadales bacterium]
MKIGICLPYMKPEYDREALFQWCRRIDEGPFHSLSCGERITGYTYDMRVMLSAAAVLTERVRINTTLYVLPMHNAVQVAKEIATLDVLSGGRVDMTIGVGGREKDYQAVGASFYKRHQRMEQQVAEMRSIWAQQPPFEGADPVGPIPLQSGGPKILVGAMGPKSMARCARYADGIYAFSMNGEKHEIDKMFNMADDAWRQAGRDSKPYRLGGFWYTLAQEQAANKLQSYVFDYLQIAGDEIARMVADTMTRHSEAEVMAGLDAMEAAGCEELFMVPATAEIAEVDRLAEIIARR